MTEVAVRGTGVALDLSACQVFVCGFAGRDEASVRVHLDELAAIGVPVPDDLPTFYELDRTILTTAPAIVVASGATSGEVEAVLVRHGGAYYVGVGSDHTDRDAERHDIAASKAACPKPVSREVVPLADCTAGGRWDEITIESRVDGRPYQNARLAGLRAPDDLLRRLEAAVAPDGDLVLFMGTPPLLDGAFRFGTEWALRLRLPDDTELKHSYTVELESSDA